MTVNDIFVNAQPSQRCRFLHSITYQAQTVTSRFTPLIFDFVYGCAALKTWGVPEFVNFARERTRDVCYDYGENSDDENSEDEDDDESGDDGLREERVPNRRVLTMHGLLRGRRRGMLVGSQATHKSVRRVISPT
jgi:hypothetical protein